MITAQERPPRRGRGKSAKSINIVKAAIKFYSENHPASVRACCYRLFIDGLIDAMTKANTDKISRLLVEAREDGVLPWDWVVDETREVERVATWDSPEDIISAAVRQYRKNYWSDQPCRIVLLSEKGTVRGTTKPIADKYGVPFRVQHGYGSATALYDLAQDAQSSDKPLHLIYCGDWDPSGLQMSEVDLPSRLARYGGVASIKRIALDHDDVGPDSHLPYFDADSKSKDPRFPWFIKNYGTRCWEVDALAPAVLRDRLETEILSHLDLDAWNHSVKIEQAETESMRSVMTAWKSISGQASKYSPDSTE